MGIHGILRNKNQQSRLKEKQKHKRHSQRRPRCRARAIAWLILKNAFDHALIITGKCFTIKMRYPSAAQPQPNDSFLFPTTKSLNTRKKYNAA
jgi:hypothetical protein